MLSELEAPKSCNQRESQAARAVQSMTMFESSWQEMAHDCLSSISSPDFSTEPTRAGRQRAWLDRNPNKYLKVPEWFAPDVQRAGVGGLFWGSAGSWCETALCAPRPSLAAPGSSVLRSPTEIGQSRFHAEKRNWVSWP